MSCVIVLFIPLVEIQEGAAMNLHRSLPSRPSGYHHGYISTSTATYPSCPSGYHHGYISTSTAIYPSCSLGCHHGYGHRPRLILGRLILPLILVGIFVADEKLYMFPAPHVLLMVWSLQRSETFESSLSLRANTLLCDLSSDTMTDCVYKI
ncbi:hypothetical protein J6590_020406 [Homalodisca vitripennis]|nr:hypothetical protein J6590_020406 [Homalodisca vitripennis]